MSKLIINRKPDWINSSREIGVYLDGELIGFVGNGHTEEFRIRPGEHRLTTRMEWYGSKTLEFHVAENEDQKVELSGFKFGKWLSPLAFLLMLVYYGFHQQLHINAVYYLIILIPVGAYFFYYLTLGHNSYLKLRKI
ncbi:MAG: hypothetical protein IH595_13260 [Bacteroidales bacterium]|nr:hypothetical protein [Bacteroidales bacterium]